MKPPRYGTLQVPESAMETMTSDSCSDYTPGMLLSVNGDEDNMFEITEINSGGTSMSYRWRPPESWLHWVAFDV